MSEPFDKSYVRYRDGRREFRDFWCKAEPLVKLHLGKNPRFPYLESMFAFFRMNDGREDALQFDFGSRSMFRKAPDGSVAAEKGPTLLYLVGPSGDVSTILYPAKSNIAIVSEDCIYLRLGFYTSAQLRGWLKVDLDDLIAYTHVTSFDGNPTLRERVRVFWLRLTRPLGVKNEFTAAAILRYTGVAAVFAAKAMTISMFRFILLLVALIGATTFGITWLAQYLPKF